MCPAWLKLSNDGSRYEIIEKRAAAIRRIFADSAAGIGNYSITQRLNKQRSRTSASPTAGTCPMSRRFEEPRRDW